MYKLIRDNRDFIVVNKYPDVSLHKDRDQEGLAGVIKRELSIRELYTVHRLDRITSGLLIFAKSGDAARQLSNMLKNRIIEKYYLAISDRKPRKKQGLVKGDMKKARRGAWKLMRTTLNPAVTRFFSYSIGGGVRLFVLRPYTGKTHQLRVALKSLGSPVLGDALYSGRKSEGSEIDRAYLHSYGLRFRWRGRNFELICKPDIGSLFIDERFLSVLEERCGIPWELTWPKV